MSTLLFGPGYVCRACRARLTAFPRRFASTERKRAKFLPEGPARTRFAPSPTGVLHLGSARTALFSYLIARRTGGQFILRIEDTDIKRTKDNAEKSILEELRWLGLQWDEGPDVGGPHGPYQQSKRFELYQKHANELVESGHAYRCFCSTDTLQQKALERSKRGASTFYDRTCYHIPKEESDSRALDKKEAHVIRLKAGEEQFPYNDIVGGPYVLSKTAARKAAVEGVWDDFILLKADGHPTYHLANVVDDHYMRITHVIRGVEWQISTPKHLSIYKAFGWSPPAFGHIGLLLNDDGSKMSKRDRAANVAGLRADGVLPEALANFLALYGWSHTRRTDYMTLKDLEDSFDLNLSNTNPMVSLAKLWFLTPKHAARRLATNDEHYQDLVEDVLQAVSRFTDSLQADSANEASNSNRSSILAPGLDPRSHRDYVDRVLRADLKNYTCAKDFVQTHSYFFLDHLEVRQDSEVPLASQCSILEALNGGLRSLQSDQWRLASIKEATNTAISNLSQPHEEAVRDHGTATTEVSITKKDVWHVLRCALTGGDKGPSLVETMDILGRDVTLSRLDAALSLAREVR